jgi:hypothetical protein
MPPPPPLPYGPETQEDRPDAPDEPALPWRDLPAVAWIRDNLWPFCAVAALVMLGSHSAGVARQDGAVQQAAYAANSAVYFIALYILFRAVAFWLRK